MQRRIKRALSTAAVIASISLAAAGCAADSGSEEPTAGVAYRDASGNCAAPPLEGVDFDAAQAFLKPFEQKATGLLVTQPLPKPIDPDTTVAYLDNGSAVSGLIWGFMEAAGQAAGVTMQRVSTGTSAQSINTALSTVVETAPDILVAAATDATFFQDQLKALEAAGTTIVYPGSTNAEEFGLLDSLSGHGASIENGKVLAASAVNFTCGTAKEFVFYDVPEFTFSQVQLEAIKEYLPTLCPDCKLRVVSIPVATMDTTAGDAIVSDLQAHPETEYFMTVADQMQIGLKAKQDLAGIDVPGIGHSSLPPNVEQIASGLQSAGYAADYNMYTWLLLDEGLRRHMGEVVAYDDWANVTQHMSRVLTAQNAGEYPHGFVAYPNMVEDFKKLWGK